MPSTRLSSVHTKATAKAEVLVEALPYLKAFRDKIFVIKYGGNALNNLPLLRNMLQDIVFLSLVGIRPVLVHGAGNKITERMKKAKGVHPKFVEGLRVTDQATLKIVESALRDLNRLLVHEIRKLGGHAVSIAGAHNRLIEAKKFKVKGNDLGFVGKVKTVHPTAVHQAIRHGQIPVVWPMGWGRDGHLYNINADQAAAALAGALGAEKLVLVTDVKGVFVRKNQHQKLLHSIKMSQAESLVKREVIVGGMIPKVRSGVAAVRARVRKTHIIDIKVQRGLLMEIFTDRGIGTEIVR